LPEIMASSSSGAQKSTLRSARDQRAAAGQRLSQRGHGIHDVLQQQRQVQHAWTTSHLLDGHMLLQHARVQACAAWAGAAGRGAAGSRTRRCLFRPKTRRFLGLM